MQTYDAIVVGVGGVGSAALFQLARRGLKVVGLEQFQIAHDRGSSHGQTRLIRKAYFEHPAYVPLLERSYQLWQDLSDQTGQELFRGIGLLQLGPPQGMVLQGVVESARQNQLSIQQLSATEVQKEFPQYVMPPECAGVFESTAGLLYVEPCIRAHVQAAEEARAEIHCQTIVDDIQHRPNSIQLSTNRGDYSAGYVVLSVGAWASRMLPIEVSFRVLRKHLHWYPTDDQRFDVNNGCPAFLYELPEGVFYGFPAIDESGVKVGEHSGGELLDSPFELDRTPDPSDDHRVQRFLSSFLPTVSLLRARHTACMYTMSPDEHFIVGADPNHRRVLFAAGLSGHGFKFTPVLGEILADMVTRGRTDHAIEFLGLERFKTRKQD